MQMKCYIHIYFVVNHLLILPFYYFLLCLEMHVSCHHGYSSSWANIFFYKLQTNRGHIIESLIPLLANLSYALYVTVYLAILYTDDTVFHSQTSISQNQIDWLLVAQNQK